jgi:hypothetical protein
MVITEIGPVPIDVPRERDGSFEPKTVRKRQRRVEGVDALVLSLFVKGLTTGKGPRSVACQHPTQATDLPRRIYGTLRRKDTVRDPTDRGRGGANVQETAPFQFRAPTGTIVLTVSRGRRYDASPGQRARNRHLRGRRVVSAIQLLSGSG